MEKYFTTKIYEANFSPDGTLRGTGVCVDVQLTPFTSDLTVDEVATYWRGCILRRSFYSSGAYIITVSLTRHPVKAFAYVYKI